MERSGKPEKEPGKRRVLLGANNRQGLQAMGGHGHEEVTMDFSEESFCSWCGDDETNSLLDDTIPSVAFPFSLTIQ